MNQALDPGTLTRGKRLLLQAYSPEVASTPLKSIYITVYYTIQGRFVSYTRISGQLQHGDDYVQQGLVHFGSHRCEHALLELGVEIDISVQSECGRTSTGLIIPSACWLNDKRVF